MGSAEKYDRNVHHDGKTNTYQYVKDDKEFMLHPMKEESGKSNNKAMKCSFRDFWKEINNIKCPPVLFPKHVQYHMHYKNLKDC